MANTPKVLIAAVALLMVAGCASQFRSDVSSWHRLQPPSGETFTIVAKDPMKAGSLEFAAYAGLVSQGLQRMGYRPAQRGTQSDLIVRVDYGLSDARTAIRSYGGYGGWGPYYGPYSFYGPYRGFGRFGYGYGGYGPDIRSYPVYNRELKMEIASAQNPGINLFETRVMSEGRSNRLEEVMPLLVESMFKDFPGPSGVTREVTIDLDENSGSY